MKSRIVSPVVHTQFRSVFEQGLDKALSEASKLQKQGWTVDLARGTLTEAQAVKLAEALKDEAETTIIPVATWMNEGIYILAYKPRPKTEPAKEERKYAPLKPAVTSEQIWENFIKIVRGGEPPDPEDAAKGYATDKGRFVAVIKPDSQEFKTVIDELRQKPSAGEYDVPKLLKGLRVAKGGPKGATHVKIGDGVYHIPYVVAMLRCVKKGMVKLYADKEKPLLIECESGNKMLVAWGEPDSPTKIIQLEDAIKVPV